MLTLLKYYLVPPNGADVEKTQMARLAYWIALAMLGVCTLVVILFLSLVPAVSYRAWLVVPMIVALLCLIPVIQRGGIRIASIFMLLGLWATLTVSAATAGGILTPAFHLYFVIVFSAGLLLGWRAAVLFFLLIFLTGLVIYYAESNALLPALLTEGQLLRTWIIFDMAVGFVAVLSGLALGDTYKALAAARRELSERVRAEQSLQAANNALVKAYDTTIEGWAHMIELRDVETQDHSERVAELATRLAERMGITGESLLHLRRGALLHDLGKIAIPDTILRKPGPLTDEEWVEMQRHPEYANRVLDSIPYLHPAREIPNCHHEKWDGSGYPCGLKGTEIPLAARIFAVIDVWDALSSDRSYRKRWSHEEVLAYLQAQRGRHFDPNAVDAFMLLIVEERDAQIKSA